MSYALRGDWARPARGISGLTRLSGARLIILISGLGFFLFVVWASLATVDEVTRGQGEVIPSSRVQIIQSSEPATISEILVRPGQTVRRGQLLVRLDDTETSSALAQIETENQALQARASRLSEEGQGAGSACAPGPEGQISAACAQETALRQARASTLRSRVAALTAAVEQRRRDLGEAQATVQ
ncbi:MAG TPA: biotin/lipoyl-binding protein, partial [Gemmatimonadales bacterium]|nr:biotin/lipoyl-binding protein [Gemmatimonadales bacterium]